MRKFLDSRRRGNDGDGRVRGNDGGGRVRSLRDCEYDGSFALGVSRARQLSGVEQAL
jgi:hypothetical protein